MPYGLPQVIAIAHLCFHAGSETYFIRHAPPHHHEEDIMPTVYVRRVNLKDSLSDAEVVAYWKFNLEAVVPALRPVSSLSVK